ncbi:MAG: serine/threonine protein phosphatase [Deltaproteobacteria bacterium]|nr:serine/threonine protein phosphatase [Deltaproteobacteria bacterium]MDQ3295323.1 serine/threonine protein phosphatase [Myxococcota bacterium]
MAGRTFAIGDIHGDLAALEMLFQRLPALTVDDTVVFLGDYIDRGPDSAGVVAYVRALTSQIPAKIVTLRGNHEDAWLQVAERGWPEFIFPRSNGCLECFRSFTGAPPPSEDELATPAEMTKMLTGKFLPPDVLEWMRGLPFFYEDEHAIYVHAGIKRTDGEFPHPREVVPARALLWLRDRDFFENYRGKLVVFGHTTTRTLPNELSTHTPEDPEDLWAGPACIGLDTACGKGGFLTAFELPARMVYESRG